MHHRLDIHPIPADVLYVNELSLAGKVPYETKDMTEKAITGKIKSKGGILPDDNVRNLRADGLECRHYYVATLFPSWLTWLSHRKE